MKVKDIMTDSVVSVSPGETVAVAARTLAQYNIGILPVCRGGKLCGLVTDRDLVTRCLAANRAPNKTSVEQIMTADIRSVRPDTDLGAAAHLMGTQQVRRLPVVEDGVLRGMVSLGDLARREDSLMDAADALMDISHNLR